MTLFTQSDFTTGTLYFGSAIDVLANINGSTFDMIFTDPPYKVISGGQSRAKDYGWATSVVHKNDGKVFAHNDIKVADYLSELYRVLKPGSHCYLMTNNLNLREFLNEAERVGFGFHNFLAWEKNNVCANRWYLKNLEYVLFLYKRPAKKINNIGSKQIFRIDNLRNKLHPTQKPIELMRHYIENSTLPGETVFDPFGGSGSTALAAIESGRRWVSCELDPEYQAVAMRRLLAVDRLAFDAETEEYV